jgi:RNA polymerase sigma-70 factor (ECF subfamily)
MVLARSRHRQILNSPTSLNVRKKQMNTIRDEARTVEEITHPETWVDLYADSLFRYALLRIADKAVAEELVQETFVSALSSLGNSRFRGESACKTWLTGILKYKLLDHLRQKYRHHAKPLEIIREDEIEESFDVRGNWRIKPGQWGVNPEKHYEQQELMLIIMECIAALGERQADAFRLRELDGEEAEEICKILKISSTNYWVLMHRARLSMRRCMELHWQQELLGRTSKIQ